MTIKETADSVQRANFNLSNAKLQLSHLNELHTSGTLSLESYEQARSLLERRILDIVLNGDLINTGSAEKTQFPAVKPSNLLLMGLGIVVLLIAASGYGWLRYSSTTALTAADSEVPFGTAKSGNGLVDGKSHSTNFDQIAAMTESLAEKLKDKPQDAEGWAMLARSYSVLGQNPEALAAYEKAVALRGDDAGLLADYADALAIKNNRKLNGDPMKAVEQALKADPRNLKALSLAGTHAFEKNDYTNAVLYWEKVIAFGPPEDNLVLQAKSSLAEARQLSAATTNLTKSEAAAPKLSSATAAKTVSGIVKISPSLLQMVKPEDTVFIFARPVQGSKMPLAVLKKQVKDLPLSFTLDDSMAMTPTAILSRFERISVGARISKSGNAMPQTGDFISQVVEVSLGDTGLAMEISDAIRK